MVNQFFSCCFENLTNIESRQQREEGLAYVCGFLCHYVGDSICHPYVYGRIEYDVDHPGGYYHGLHAQLENDIDALLLRKYKKKKPSQFNQAATICLNGMETQFISRFLSNCINEAYLSAELPQPLPGHRADDPPLHPGHPLRLPHAGGPLRQEKEQNRVCGESIFLKNPVASNKLVTDTVADPAWSLNLHHETWCNPWNKQIASQASFPDLFKQSLSKLDTIYYMINSLVDGTPRCGSGLPGSSPERDRKLFLSQRASLPGLTNLQSWSGPGLLQRPIAFKQKTAS